jgi:hypothetical protein
MNPGAGFVDLLRRRADRGYRRNAALGISAIAILLLGILGWYIFEPPQGEARVISLIWVALFMGGIWFFWRGMHLGRPLAEHPLGEALAAHGNLRDVIDEVDAEFAGQDLRGSPFKVGKRWICFVRGTDVVVERVDNLVWVYAERVVHNFMNAPCWATSRIVLWRADGTAALCPLPKRHLVPSLGRLRAIADWMPIGYNTPLRETWNADRPELIALVSATRGSRLRFAETAPRALVSEDIKATPWVDRLLIISFWLLITGMLGYLVVELVPLLRT